MPIDGTKNQAYHLDFIYGVKGIAILLICLVHAYGLIHEGHYFFLTSSHFIENGARGVQLLFMVSAFTLMHSNRIVYRVKKRIKNIPRNFVNLFLKRRIIRILPLWILAVITGSVITGSFDILKILSSITFVFGFFRFLPNSEIVVGGWAIFAEIIFYLVFPIIFTKIMDVKSSIKFLTVTIIVSMIWRTVVERLGLPVVNSFSFLFPLYHAYSFGLGILLYFIYETHKLDQFSAMWVNTWSILGLFLYLSRNYDLSTLGIFLLFICMSQKSSKIGIVARNFLLKFIGKISYPIFLSHFYVIIMLEKYINRGGIALFSGFPNEFRLFVVFLVLMIIVIPIAYLLNKYIEVPISHHKPILVRT
jgi:peptidoglycan/LPS O-acetylase OafA/YrhL